MPLFRLEMLYEISGDVAAASGVEHLNRKWNFWREGELKTENWRNSNLQNWRQKQWQKCVQMKVYCLYFKIVVLKIWKKPTEMNETVTDWKNHLVYFAIFVFGAINSNFWQLNAKFSLRITQPLPLKINHPHWIWFFATEIRIRKIISNDQIFFS